MAHSHDRGSARHVRPLAITFALVAVFFVVEVVAGLVTNSPEHAFEESQRNNRVHRASMRP